MRTTDHSRLNGIALINWTLRTETPLCIKSGTTSIYEKDENKDKNKKIINFLKKDSEKNAEGTISDFYFDVLFDEPRKPLPEAVFRIPASSVRGALRNYTIKRLIPKDLQDAALFAKIDDKETKKETLSDQNEKLKKALKDPGWRLIQNLFGIAADSGDEELEKETVAGRLQVISDNIVMKTEELNQKGAPIYVVPRSPLDRVTMGTKEGGLHNFMELKPGYEFNVDFRLLNPENIDLGFFTFWEKSIEKGLIRLGGLSGAGKGRLMVSETTTRIYKFEASRADLDESKDVLSLITKKHVISSQEEKAQYLKQLTQHYNELKRGMNHE